ncbi:sensor histidine kinase [Streptomyces oceani]|uniref:histidine kinase n=1 Tax=Streptomyces oceani TaxID=1075402 RepID=A0A1E7KEX4_9ACTN|nr:sensor domain-containing protein [Streptomyces oceani]OEV02468.1 histidine kinase [Streptomyces oceani]
MSTRWRPLVRDSLLAGARGLALCLLSIGASLALFVLSVLSMLLILLGVGVFTTPLVMTWVRMHANQRRLLAAQWSGVSIPPPYRPLPRDLRPGVTGMVERTTVLIKDPATWRDILWLLVDAIAGFVTALLALAPLVYGLEGLLIMAGLWVPLSGGYWYAVVPVDGFGSALLCGLFGVLFLSLGLAANRYPLQAHFLMAKSLLAPTRGAQLSQRVEQLYETRHDAVDSSAAELRRIERDLHDGAQARLVAMGMSLGTVESLIEKDPAKAKEVLAHARSASAEALTELRDLVRGIHPPVLAERGLGDATRALALRMQVPVEVDVELPGRFEEPVESAAYFSVSEVLTNAAKHSDATQVWLDIHYSKAAGGMLRIAVTDNGNGGASLHKGSGMRGIERRLGALDGVLAVSSPSGGPTLVTMEIPCEVSRARG